MKNRIMTLEQAYRYVLRRVDWNTRLQQRLRFIKARKAEKFQFCAFNSEDSMWAFLSGHGNGIIVSVDGFYQYARV